ncbi:DUF2945 domain-containing protein [Bdellovibrio sp. ArHS]|uniref:DUF2945 domain-containing protein n=1 Tax=Bdellovibrio sp. ArHS TaxID=1569284 RepID=UPI0025BA5922|nr:DUF2945 domain-containing protein [Bdellovibrio sp. ArHS]
MAIFRKKSKVEWQWLGRSIKGHVVEVFKKPVTLEIKGKKITRNGSPEKPAYLVVSEAGNEALKLETELTAQGKAPAKKFKIFS